MHIMQKLLLIRNMQYSNLMCLKFGIGTVVFRAFAGENCEKF